MDPTCAFGMAPSFSRLAQKISLEMAGIGKEGRA